MRGLVAPFHYCTHILSPAPLPSFLFPLPLEQAKPRIEKGIVMDDVVQVVISKASSVLAKKTGIQTLPLDFSCGGIQWSFVYLTQNSAPGGSDYWFSLFLKCVAGSSADAIPFALELVDTKDPSKSILSVVSHKFEPGTDCGCAKLGLAYTVKSMITEKDELVVRVYLRNLALRKKEKTDRRKG